MCQICNAMFDDLAFDSEIHCIVIGSGSRRSKNFTRYLCNRDNISIMISISDVCANLLIINFLAVVRQLVPERVIVVVNVLVIVVLLVKSPRKISSWP